MKKDNFAFILVEPREGGNIGAAARAIKNMGFTSLELVNPADHLTAEAYAFAHGAEEILEGALVFDDFDEAVGDKSIIVGTSRRRGKTRGVILPVKEGVSRIVSFSANNKVGILFGNEKNGLIKAHVDRCGLIMNIPTDTSHPSLNLGQAVLITAYEISQHFIDDMTDIPELLPQEAIEPLYFHIRETLKLLDYGFRGSEDLESAVMRNLRHLVGRYGLTNWEANMLHGLCTQIEKKLSEKV